MRKLLLCLGVFWSLSSFANANVEQVKAALADVNNCRNFLKSDSENLFLGYGFYSNSEGGFHLPKPTSLTIIPIANPENKKQIEITDSAIDMLFDGDQAYILTYTGLEQWDRKSWTRVATYPTYGFDTSFAFEEHATQMARYKDQLIISHGRLGFSVFDLNTKKIKLTMKLAQDRLPLESKVTGVAVVGDKAYFAVDSFTMVQDPNAERPFQGMVVVNLVNYKVEEQLDGMEPGSDNLFAYDNKLIISFYGIPLMKYDVSKLTGKRMPGPTHRISIFPEMGRLLGKPTLEGDYIYTCFQNMEGDTIKRVPRVWLRKDLKLDK